MKSLIVVGLSAGLLTACVPDILNTEPEVRGLEGAAPVQTFTDPESGTDITVRPGGQLRLKLESIPTTGYFWFLKDIDASQIDQLSDDYVADPAPEGMVGGGGHQLFVFEALSTGRSNLVLSYQRHPEVVFETSTLNIKVRE